MILRAFFEIRIFFFKNSKKLFFAVHALDAILIELEGSTRSRKMRESCPQLSQVVMKGLGLHLHNLFWRGRGGLRKWGVFALAPPFLRILQFWFHFLPGKFHCAQKRSDNFFAISPPFTFKIAHTFFANFCFSPGKHQTIQISLKITYNVYLD